MVAMGARRRMENHENCIKWNGKGTEDKKSDFLDDGDKRGAIHTVTRRLLSSEGHSLKYAISFLGVLYMETLDRPIVSQEERFCRYTVFGVQHTLCFCNDRLP